MLAAKPDIIVLATGNADYMPLIQNIRRLGIRVEVASFKESAAREMILKSQGFINLDEYYKIYLSSMQNEDRQHIESNKEDNNIDQANYSDDEII